MGAKGGRPPLPEGMQRTKSWRRMITPEEWRASQAYLDHFGKTMAEVILDGPPLKDVIREGRKLLAKGASTRRRTR